MKQILLAVDGSAHSRRAAEYVVRLLRGGPPRTLHVAHVEEAVPMRTHAYMSKEEIDKLYQQEDKKQCGGVREYLRGEKVEFQWHLLVGDAAERIVELANQLKVDAIVIGSQGLGAVSSLVLGSVARKIIDSATVPVTIVK